MALSDRRAGDAAMAARMKKHPSQFPDSAMRPWNGRGAEYRKMGAGRKARHTINDWGLFGGILAAKLGFGSFGIPPELLK